MYYGFIRKYKGLDYLLKALSKLKTQILNLLSLEKFGIKIKNFGST